MEYYSNGSPDNFSPVFKFYKQRKVNPTLTDVIGYPSFNSLKDNLEFSEFQPSCKLNLAIGIRCTPWKVIHVKDVPGLYIITNIFTRIGVKEWSRRCLEEYSKHPNKTNLDKTYSKEELNELWSQSSSVLDLHKSGTSEFHDKEIGRLLKSTLIWKLRWSTLGFHHDWDTKVYDTSDTDIAFPHELDDLCSILASSVKCHGFKSEAAIVNYYHEGSTLCAHTDHSEHNMEPPVISLSFGLPAIFLIGGSTKATAPKAILLRSGCAVIMSGPARKAYHAVARILPDESPLPEDCDALDMFLKHTRININVRQVL